MTATTCPDANANAKAERYIPLATKLANQMCGALGLERDDAVGEALLALVAASRAHKNQGDFAPYATVAIRRALVSYALRTPKAVALTVDVPGVRVDLSWDEVEELRGKIDKVSPDAFAHVEAIRGGASVPQVSAMFNCPYAEVRSSVRIVATVVRGGEVANA